eukprot:1348248-Amphidinium_carterae.1
MQRRVTDLRRAHHCTRRLDFPERSGPINGSVSSSSSSASAGTDQTVEVADGVDVPAADRDPMDVD